MSGILMLLGFFLAAILMFMRYLPTIVALPLMAVWMSVTSGMSFQSFMNDVLLGGSVKLSAVMIVVVFGAMFAKVMSKTGISDEIINMAAELSSDEPFLLAFILWFATTLVFMGVAGLGAIIMVGSIALPLLTGVGISPIVAVCIILLGLQAGGALNMASYATYIGIFGGEVAVAYLIPAATISIIGAIVFMLINVPIKNIRSIFSGFLILLTGFWKGIISIFTPNKSQEQDEEYDGIIIQKRKVPVITFISPIIPLLTVFALRLTIGFDVKNGGIDPSATAILGFILASIFAILLTNPREIINIISGAMVEGIKDVAGVIFLFIGIGMVAAAVMNEEATLALTPILKAVIPESPIGVAILFACLAPLALYRGPLNMFGMGVGLAAVLVGMDIIPPLAACGLFYSVGFLQGICDPTNSHNTWLSGFVSVDGNSVMKKLLPYAWGMCIAMVCFVVLCRW